jgi:glycosyltransferase involved in cell wall biosynthesis
MFSVQEIEAFKLSHPQVRCIHRVNECDLRKGTHEIDEILRQANRNVDFTVFVSHWLRDYFVDRWFDPRRPHRVIQNGADPKLFYPRLDREYADGEALKLVTHHWSDNWNKGFKVYEQVDRMIDQGDLEGFALMVIGRWPVEIRWRVAATHAPVRGKQLADLLRQNHLYLTGSLWEPSGMHYIEGAQCGLPLVYHEDGGGIVEFGERYGMSFRDDIKTTLIEARKHYQSLRAKVLAEPPSGLAMCQEYEVVLTR